MNISSTIAPDLQAICRTALSRDVAASAPIGTGRNSRVFRVELGDGVRHEPAQVVVKFYRRDAGDVRDRLGTEFGTLKFLWQNGMRSVPRPIAVAPDRECAIYEFIAGEPVSPGAATAEDVDASVAFLAALRQLRGARGSEALRPASEACFTLGEIVASVDQRVARLRSATSAGDDVARRLHDWIDATFAPLRDEIVEWCARTAGSCGIGFDDPIDREARTLSPSDFGFHNVIRRPDGSLAFVDFEYFGWDDPAKTIVDYLLHPGMALDDRLKHRFAERALAAFADVRSLPARARVVYPLFGLKWTAILLNDFLPERASQSDGDRRTTQFANARTFVAGLAGAYADNAFLS